MSYNSPPFRATPLLSSPSPAPAEERFTPLPLDPQQGGNNKRKPSNSPLPCVAHDRYTFHNNCGCKSPMQQVVLRGTSRGGRGEQKDSSKSPLRSIQMAPQPPSLLDDEDEEEGQNRTEIGAADTSSCSLLAYRSLEENTSVMAIHDSHVLFLATATTDGWANTLHRPMAYTLERSAAISGSSSPRLASASPPRNVNATTTTATAIRNGPSFSYHVVERDVLSSRKIATYAAPLTKLVGRMDATPTAMCVVDDDVLWIGMDDGSILSWSKIVSGKASSSASTTDWEQQLLNTTEERPSRREGSVDQTSCGVGAPQVQKKIEAPSTVLCQWAKLPTASLHSSEITGLVRRPMPKASPSSSSSMSAAAAEEEVVIFSSCRSGVVVRWSYSRADGGKPLLFVSPSDTGVPDISYLCCLPATDNNDHGVPCTQETIVVASHTSSVAMLILHKACPPNNNGLSEQRAFGKRVISLVTSAAAAVASPTSSSPSSKRRGGAAPASSNGSPHGVVTAVASVHCSIASQSLIVVGYNTGVLAVWSLTTCTEGVDTSGSSSRVVGKLVETQFRGPVVSIAPLFPGANMSSSSLWVLSRSGECAVYDTTSLHEVHRRTLFANTRMTNPVSSAPLPTMQPLGFFQGNVLWSTGVNGALTTLFVPSVAARQRQQQQQAVNQRRRASPGLLGATFELSADGEQHPLITGSFAFQSLLLGADTPPLVSGKHSTPPLHTSSTPHVVDELSEFEQVERSLQQQRLHQSLDTQPTEELLGSGSHGKFLQFLADANAEMTSVQHRLDEHMVILHDVVEGQLEALLKIKKDYASNTSVVSQQQQQQPSTSRTDDDEQQARMKRAEQDNEELSRRIQELSDKNTIMSEVLAVKDAQLTALHETVNQLQKQQQQQSDRGVSQDRSGSLVHEILLEQQQHDDDDNNDVGDADMSTGTPDAVQNTHHVPLSVPVSPMSPVCSIVVDPTKESPRPPPEENHLVIVVKQLQQDLDAERRLHDGLISQLNDAHLELNVLQSEWDVAQGELKEAKNAAKCHKEQAEALDSRYQEAIQNLEASLLKERLRNEDLAAAMLQLKTEATAATSSTIPQVQDDEHESRHDGIEWEEVIPVAVATDLSDTSTQTDEPIPIVAAVSVPPPSYPAIDMTTILARLEADIIAMHRSQQDDNAKEQTEAIDPATKTSQPSDDVASGSVMTTDATSPLYRDATDTFVCPRCSNPSLIFVDNASLVGIAKKASDLLIQQEDAHGPDGHRQEDSFKSLDNGSMSATAALILERSFSTPLGVVEEALASMSSRNDALQRELALYRNEKKMLSETLESEREARQIQHAEEEQVVASLKKNLEELTALRADEHNAQNLNEQTWRQQIDALTKQLEAATSENKTLVKSYEEAHHQLLSKISDRDAMFAAQKEELVRHAEMNLSKLRLAMLEERDAEALQLVERIRSLEATLSATEKQLTQRNADFDSLQETSAAQHSDLSGQLESALRGKSTVEADLHRFKEAISLLGERGGEMAEELCLVMAQRDLEAEKVQSLEAALKMAKESEETHRQASTELATRVAYCEDQIGHWQARVSQSEEAFRTNDVSIQMMRAELEQARSRERLVVDEACDLRRELRERDEAIRDLVDTEEQLRSLSESRCQELTELVEEAKTQWRLSAATVTALTERNAMLERELEEWKTSSRIDNSGAVESITLRSTSGGDAIRRNDEVHALRQQLNLQEQLIAQHVSSARSLKGEVDTLRVLLNQGKPDDDNKQQRAGKVAKKKQSADSSSAMSNKIRTPTTAASGVSTDKKNMCSHQRAQQALKAGGMSSSATNSNGVCVWCAGLTHKSMGGTFGVCADPGRFLQFPSSPGHETQPVVNPGRAASVSPSPAMKLCNSSPFVQRQSQQLRQSPPGPAGAASPLNAVPLMSRSSSTAIAALALEAGLNRTGS